MENDSATFLNLSEDLRNSLEWRVQYYSITVPVLVALTVAAFLTNFYIVSLSRRVRRPMAIILKITLGLAAADCWTSIVLAAGLILNSYLYAVWHLLIPRQNCVALVIETFRLAAIMTSILHLLLISLNHYAAIATPRGVRLLNGDSPLGALMCYFFIWIAPPVFFFLGFSLVPNQGFQSPICNLGFMAGLKFRLIIFLLLLLPILVMAAVYLAMIITLLKVQRHFSRQNRRSQSVEMKWRTMRTTMLMLGSFLIGWIPSGVLFLLMSKELHESIGSYITAKPKVTFAISVVVNALMILKSFLNPLIYAIRVPEIRECMWKPALPSSLPASQANGRTSISERAFGRNRITELTPLSKAFSHRRNTTLEQSGLPMDFENVAADGEAI